MLEPRERKLSRVVLRGSWRSNTLTLPAERVNNGPNLPDLEVRIENLERLINEALATHGVHDLAVGTVTLIR